MKGFLKALFGLTMMFCIAMMSCAAFAASDSPKDFKVAIDLMYGASDQGVPMQVNIVTYTFEARKIVKPDYLNPWNRNVTNPESPVMYAELSFITYCFDEPVQRINNKSWFSQLYHAPPILTIDRYSDTQRNSG